MDPHTQREEAEFLNDPGYKRGFGAYKPKFQGIPEGYYPNSVLNILLIVYLVFQTYGICILLWYGLISWAFVKTSTYVYVWCGITLFYIFLMVSLMIWGSKVRAVKEAEMIEEKVKLEKTLLDGQSQAQPDAA